MSHPSVSGTAKIKGPLGEILDILPDDLAWEVSGEDARSQGTETQHSATIQTEDGGEITWSIWEYPAGAYNTHDRETHNLEIIEDFSSFTIEHEPE